MFRSLFGMAYKFKKKIWHNGFNYLLNGKWKIAQVEISQRLENSYRADGDTFLNCIVNRVKRSQYEWRRQM